MTKELIRKYIWLIDTVNQAGSTGITFKDIRSKWERNDLLSGGIQYPKRSFHNHVTAIRELFGIEIACNKNTNSYYIANSRELKDSSGFKGWLLDALSLNNQLEESSQLKDRILLEENPSGRELLPTILEAMRDNKMLTFSYKPYWVEDDHISNLYHVEPYALKVFKRRWYLLGKYGDSPLKVYALDRILDIDIEFESFTLPADFDAESFFSSCFGIIVSDEDPQTIKLKVDAFQSNYLRSLPLHPSQKETERTEEYSVFTYFLRPTFDFIQELLTLRETAEVLAPKELRAEMARIGKNIANKNGGRRQ
ncbi:MAG: WYL domain-containing protein [Bacteroidales bacterium]|nr:WYL domain-containing protein [Bacteroidales bacterium]